MDELIYYLSMSSNQHIGPRRYQKIRSGMGTLAAFFDLKPREQMEFLGLKHGVEDDAFETMLAQGEKIMKACFAKGIKTLRLEDPLYPPKLRELSDAPFLLYLLGELNYSMKMVAVVGTRDASHEAAQVNEFFSAELVSYHIGIVSGLARGHDMISQKAALDNDGYTIAVLGSGVDTAYPAQARELYARIKASGAILSEYPPGAVPFKSNFPLRNRIISGLSDAVLVIQAPEKSGALITARYAETQGRDLYAVPGSPADMRSAGSNLLIQNGARIALNPKDLVLDLLGGKAVKRAPQISKEEISLSREEEIILKNIPSETCIDEIAEKTGIPIAALAHLLTLLEIRGLVLQYPGGYFVKNSLMI